MLWFSRMEDQTNFDGRHEGKFFEEFFTHDESDSVKCIGVRIVESAQGRKLGSEGLIKSTFTEPLVLLRCFKEVQIKASKERPVKVFSMLQKLGRK